MLEESQEELWISLQICGNSCVVELIQIMNVTVFKIFHINFFTPNLDSSFPGGSFAHSLGLESALHHNFVNNALGALDLFVSQTLEQAKHQLIPLVCAAHAAYSNRKSSTLSRCATSKGLITLDDLMQIDGICHISLTNEVARRSSVTQGKS
jgi:urease accessory protein UreF